MKSQDLANGIYNLDALRDCGKVLTNIGAADTVRYNLPPATVGQHYRFVRVEAFILNVRIDGTDNFRYGGAVAPGQIQQVALDVDVTLSSVVDVFCVENGVWDLSTPHAITYTTW